MSWLLLLLYMYRGDALGDCGGCQVMSNPLILHGTQIALPKHRPPIHPNPSPLPQIPEGTAESPPCNASSTLPETHANAEGAAQMANPQAQVTSSQAEVGGPQLTSACQPQSEKQPAPVRSALSTSLPLGTAASQAARPAAKAALAAAAKEPVDSKDKERVLNADERLKRLKLRMQHTIQAYSGNVSSAAGVGRYSRTQSLTAASLHTADHRMNSSPVRASRVSMCAVSQGVSEESSSCHNSSSCSSAATPASMESSAKGAAQRVATGAVSSQRGIHQVAILNLPVYKNLALCCLFALDLVCLVDAKHVPGTCSHTIFDTPILHKTGSKWTPC